MSRSSRRATPGLPTLRRADQCGRARKVYTTFRYLGLLVGPSGGPLTVTEQLVVPNKLVGWVAHGLLLTRGIGALDRRDLTSAPEIFPLKIVSNSFSDYPLLESHAEGSSRVVLVPRTAI